MTNNEKLLNLVDTTTQCLDFEFNDYDTVKVIHILHMIRNRYGFGSSFTNWREVADKFLYQLLNYRNVWNTDLSRYNYAGEVVEFDFDEVMKELSIKKDSIILCGHVTRIYHDNDAYSIELLGNYKWGNTVDICEDCFKALIGKGIYTHDSVQYQNYIKNNYSGDDKHNALSPYIFFGTFAQLQIALEKIKG